jgi:outer membrane protein TolC
MMQRIILSLLLTVSFWPAGLSQEKRSLTVEQSIEIGLEENKALHASRMSVEAAEARSSEANASQLPALRAYGSYTRLSDVPPFQISVPSLGSFTVSPSIVNNYNMRISLQQPVFTGFRLQSGASMAENTAKAANADYNRDRAELKYQITVAYWNLFKAKEFKKLIDENVSQVNAHVQDVQNFLNQGMATNNDLLKVQVQFSNVVLMQIDANNNVRLATLALNNIMGIPLNTEVELVSAPAAEPGADKEMISRLLALPDVDTYIRQAIEQRPELKAMEYRVEAGENGVTMAKSGWFPQIYLTGNYNYARPNQRIVPAQDIFKDTWDVSVTASWDIWNWGTTSHQTNNAQAQLAQLQDHRSRLQDGISLEVTQNYLALKQAGEKIAVAQQSVAQAEENYRVTREKFKSGIALNSDLLDAEVALLQSKTSYTQSLVDYRLSEASLQKAVGN